MSDQLKAVFSHEAVLKLWQEGSLIPQESKLNKQTREKWIAYKPVEILLNQSKRLVLFLFDFLSAWRTFNQTTGSWRRVWHGLFLRLIIKINYLVLISFDHKNYCRKWIILRTYEVQKQFHNNQCSQNFTEVYCKRQQSCLKKEFPSAWRP